MTLVSIILGAVLAFATVATIVVGAGFLISAAIFFASMRD